MVMLWRPTRLLITVVMTGITCESRALVVCDQNAALNESPSAWHMPFRSAPIAHSRPVLGSTSSPRVQPLLRSTSIAFSTHFIFGLLFGEIDRVGGHELLLPLPAVHYVAGEVSAGERELL